MPILAETPNNCCGCGACVDICPKDAIKFKCDSEGFLYPEVNAELCCECGLCEGVCDFCRSKDITSTVKSAYACINKDESVLKSSTSGGVFTALAQRVIDASGVVVGCVLDGDLKPVHICAENTIDIEKMRGSKYVQSDMGNNYKRIKNYINAGRKVLFSGTPCQVAALKSFLGSNSENLITVDFACHGVPSAKMFADYISYLETTESIKVTGYNFRSKHRGWPGMVNEITFYDKVGRKKTRIIGSMEEFYFAYFTNGCIVRPSCFNCAYANAHRNSDITMGDFWGHEKAGLNVDTTKGLSVCLTNTEKGERLIAEIMDTVNVIKVDREIAISGNPTFKNPIWRPKSRERVMDIYENYGTKELAKYYKKTNRKARLKSIVTKNIAVKKR